MVPGYYNATVCWVLAAFLYYSWLKEKGAYTAMCIYHGTA